VEAAEQARDTRIRPLAAQGREATAPVERTDRPGDEVWANRSRHDGDTPEQDKETAHRYWIVIVAFMPAA
jgi:hypothetical protein